MSPCHLASPGVVASLYPELFRLPCLTLPHGSHVLGTERRPGQESSQGPAFLVPFSSQLHHPSVTSFSPFPLQPHGCLLLQVQAPQRRGRYDLMVGILQDEPGLLELAQKTRAPSHGPCLGCVVTRGLFPTWEACPCYLLMVFHASGPHTRPLTFCVEVSEGPGAGPLSRWPRQSDQFEITPPVKADCPGCPGNSSAPACLCGR